MNENETALADKILKEATEAGAHERSNLLDQYDRLVRAALTRRAANGKPPVEEK